MRDDDDVANEDEDVDDEEDDVDGDDEDVGGNWRRLLFCSKMQQRFGPRQRQACGECGPRDDDDEEEDDNLGDDEICKTNRC